MHHPNSSRGRRTRNLALAGAILIGAGAVGSAASAVPAKDVDIEVTKTLTSGPTVAPGGTVTYAVTVKNVGSPIQWDRVTVSDAAATTFDFVKPLANNFKKDDVVEATATIAVPNDVAVCAFTVTNTASVLVTAEKEKDKDPKAKAKSKKAKAKSTKAIRPTARLTRGIQTKKDFPLTFAATAETVTVAGGICDTPLTPLVTPPTTTPTTIVGLRPPGPALSVNKTGPARAIAGATAAYRITLTNVGDATATGVTLTDIVPPGMMLVGRPAGTTVAGKNVRWTLGDLAPNQSVSATVRLRSSRTISGRRCNLARATSTNAAQVEDRACTTVRGLVGQRPPVTG
jgi:uncharacterized repeat protein (TIGR01451 family)